MLLDEELEQIYFANEGRDDGERCQLLIKACCDRMGDPNAIGQYAWFNNIKRTDALWRLFTKRHQEFKPDGLKELLREVDKDGALFKALGWT